MDENLKNKLTPEEYHITQEKGTERPFENAFWNKTEKGMYTCKVCGQTLFSSDTKLDIARGPMGLQGWPAFDQAIPGTVEFVDDISHGMKRTEVICSKCKSHLGHVFDDPSEKTGKHFCVNSAGLCFEEINK